MSKQHQSQTHHTLAWCVLLATAMMFVFTFGFYHSTESAAHPDTPPASEPDTAAETSAASFPIAIVNTVTPMEQPTSTVIAGDSKQSPEGSVLGIDTPNAADSKNTTVEVASSKETPTSSLSLDIHTLTNRARADRGLSPLFADSKLRDLATARSEEMVREHYFSHTSPNGCDLACRFKDSHYETLMWGENLATFSDVTALSAYELAETFVTNWLASNNHRDNLLSRDFTHHGIGLAYDGDRVVVTVIFAKQ